MTIAPLYDGSHSLLLRRKELYTPVDFLPQSRKECITFILCQAIVVSIERRIVRQVPPPTPLDPSIRIVLLIIPVSMCSCQGS